MCFDLYLASGKNRTDILAHPIHVKTHFATAFRCVYLNKPKVYNLLSIKKRYTLIIESDT